MAKTLEELRERIDDEVPYVDVKPFSHNIISLTLQMIDKQYGKKEANKAIGDFGLEKLGWRKVEK